MEKRFIVSNFHDIVSDLHYAIHYSNISQADKEQLSASELVLHMYCYMLNSGLEDAQMIREAVYERTNQAVLDTLELALINTHEQLIPYYNQVWDTIDCEEDVYEVSYKPNTSEVIVTIKISLALQRQLAEEAYNKQNYDPFVEEFVY